MRRVSVETAEKKRGSAQQTVAPRTFPVGTQELVPLLRREDRLLEDEVAQIAHDLKNPLGAISLEATLLDERFAHVDRIDALRSVIRIQQNVAFLDRIVLDLLDVCALMSGQFVLHRAPTELRTLLETVIARAAGPARDRVFLEAPATIVTHIDDLRIERVVANLLDNALKYAPGSSGVVLRLALRDGHACVSVIDAGPGIDSEELAHVFERYRRGDSALGTRGSGLGLYASKRIVEAHGGTIGVESTRGVGSRFYFSIPL